MRLRLLTFALLTLNSGVALAQSPAARDADEILAQMRANDAAFEQVWMRYVRGGEITRERPREQPTEEEMSTWRYRPIDPDDVDLSNARVIEITQEDIDAVPADDLEAAREFAEQERAERMETFQYLYDEEVCIRGPGFAARRSPHADMDARYASECVSRQWRVVGSELRTLTGLGGNPDDRIYWFLHISNRDVDVISFRDDCVWVRFALGIGYGEHITAIDTVEPIEGGHRLTGRMQVWATDASIFEIEVDELGIVRDARIRCDVEGHIAYLTVETQGTHESDTSVCAEMGTFQLVREPFETPHTAFSIQMVELECQPDDARFEQLLDIAAPEGAEVVTFDYSVPESE